MNSSASRAAKSVSHDRTFAHLLSLQWQVTALVGMIALSLAGCASTRATTSAASTPHAATPTAASSPTQTLAPLPVFSDWRAAYLGQDGNLHAVSLDGQNDVSGPHLPDLGPDATDTVSAGFSPNGHVLAYSATVNPHLISVANGQSIDLPIKEQVVYAMAWSPDGSQIVLGDNTGGFTVAQAGNAADVSLPTATTGAWQMWQLIGWIDNTHLVAYLAPTSTTAPSSVPVTSAGIYDLATHQLRVIATFSSEALGEGYFSLSPDGTRALFYNRPFRGNPYTPQVDEIDVATRAVTTLPAIAQAMAPGGSGFSSVAWRPGTNTVAASTGYMENGNLKTWLVNLDSDTMTQIAPTGYPMGWAPNNGPLVLSSGWQSQIGAGPYTLTAVTCASSTQCSATTLTSNAMAFTFLGFVRTA